MNDYERELQERVEAKYRPITRMMWSGFAMLFIWILLIIGGILQLISAGVAIALGVLALLIPIAAGIIFGQEMIKQSLIEEEEQRMTELGLLEKRKHNGDDRLELGEDGELVDYAFYDGDEQAGSYS